MKKLIDVFAIEGRTIEVLTDYIQAYIDRQWQQVWVQNLNEIANIYEKGGDVAYGVYISKLFRSVTRELYETSLNPKPVLPGNFRQSEERWGSWEERERRFWSVIQQENDTPLGTLVTRFFHDHTCLRIPQPPKVYSLNAINPVDISRSILVDELEYQMLINKKKTEEG